MSSCSSRSPGRRCPLLLLLRVLLELSSSGASAASDVVMRFQPSFVHDLVEGHERSVLLTAAVPRARLNDARNYSIVVRSLDQTIADVTPSWPVSMCRPHDDGSEILYFQLNVTIHGRFLGKTGLECAVLDDMADDGFELDEETYTTTNGGGRMKTKKEKNCGLDLWVKRDADSERLNKLFVWVLMILIPIANVMMGCALDLNVVLHTFKTPIAPAIGFVTQFLIMPLLAFAIAQMVLVKHGYHSFALGLFVTGCAPGGGASNFWTILLDGNAHLSVTMTFISTIASLGMMPLWITLLGERFLQPHVHSSFYHELSGEEVAPVFRVPYGRIVGSLMILVVPLLIGAAIAHFKPQWGARMRKFLRPFIVFILLFLIIFGVLANSYMFKLMNGPVLLAGLLLPWCGFAFGCFASILLRQPPPNVTAIAIETGIQNTGIAIMLLKVSFPEPDADLSALLPVIVACFTPGPLLLGVGVHSISKWFGKRKSPAGSVSLRTAADDVTAEHGDRQLELIAGSTEGGRSTSRLLTVGDDKNLSFS